MALMTDEIETPKRGRRFEHARYFQGDGAERRPDVCTVTTVRQGWVFYRTETGMGMKQAADRFADNVKQWID